MGWQDAPEEATSKWASAPELELSPEERRLQLVAGDVAKMGWLERQATAFGENARHAIRQGANLLGRVGIPGAPTDQELLEESRNLGPLNRAAPVAAFLGGASIAAPPAVALAPVRAGLLPLAAAGGATGAAEGAVFSDPGQRGRNAALGGAVGVGVPLALGGAGQLAGKVANYSGQKAGEAVGRAAQKVNADVAGELASETGKLGGLSQDMNRKIEWVIRLLDEEKSGALSPASRAALEAFRQSPEYAQVLEKATERVLATAPSSVSRTAAQEAKVAQLAQDLPQTVADRTTEAVGRDAAWEQLKARLLRYGLPALGGAMGLGTHGGAVGAGIGALAGAGMRPMMHSLIRMSQNPAVQNQFWSALEGAGRAGASMSPEAIAGLTAAAREAAPESFAEYLAEMLRRKSIADAENEPPQTAAR